MRTKKIGYQLFASLVIAATLLSACGPKAAGGQLNVIAPSLRQLWTRAVARARHAGQQGRSRSCRSSWHCESRR